jgi:anti-sigma factor RsiW
MNTSTHPVTQEEVMALLDGELSVEQGQRVSAHVQGCPECAAIAGQLGSVSGSLSGWKVPPVPEKVARSVADSAAKIRFGGRIAGPNLFLRASFWSWKQWVLGLGLATSALILLVAISIPNLMRSKAPAEKAAEDRALNGRPLDSLVTLSQPGVAADSNGVLHGLGDHVQKGVSVDGQPVADEESKTFSDAIPGSRPPASAMAPMVARTVSLNLLVKDFAVARANLDAIVARHHGYAAELTANTAEGAPRTLQASLRVPAPELAATLSELKTLGRVENESQSGEEVTQQHADLLARLKNARETEQRLQAILQQRTGKIGDVLAVEQEIARVRGEIEQMEAEQVSLEHRVEFATVNLQFADEYKAQLVIPALSGGTRLHNAVVEGCRNVWETLLGIVLFFAEYGPTLLIWVILLGAPAFFLWRRYRRSLAAI